MIYIGITGEKTPEKRWRNGGGYKYNKHFTKAIIKYGWNNFKHNILFSGLKREDAEQKEKELIAFYNSTNPLKGYNHDLGGMGLDKISEEGKEKISQKTSKKVICLETMKEYQSIKEAAKQNNLDYGSIAQCCRKEYKTAGQLHWMFLKDYSSEEKEKILQSPKKETDRKVMCVETRKIYNTIKEAENETGITSIWQNCFNKSLRTEKYHWLFLEDANDENINYILKNSLKFKQKVFCLERQEWYCSTREAERQTGINHNRIIACCKHKQRTAGEYHWFYEKDIVSFLEIKKDIGKEK